MTCSTCLYFETNVVIAIIDERDSNHNSLVRVLGRISVGSLYTG
ncbi:MAG: hypothetical protein QW604_04025 [Fervidicoccaceae archaeon]